MKRPNLAVILSTTVVVLYLMTGIALSADWQSGTGTFYVNPTTTNVGIGTTSPGGKLDVAQSSGSDYFRISRPGGFNTYGFSTSNNGTANGLSLVDVTNSAIRLFVDNPGNIGIGTSNPVGKLEVVGNTNWASGWRTGIVSTSADYPTFRLRATGSGKTSFIGNDNDGGLWFGVNGSDSAYGIIPMTILPSGNVGIGTSTPSARLEVSGGNTYMYTTSVGRSGSHYQEIGYNVGFTGTNDTYTYRVTDTAASMRMGYDGFEFRTAPSGTASSSLALSEKMRISANGNVGIGTTSPAYKLSVNGTIQAKEVKVETGWSDYVFDDNYTLPSLAQVESYVKENKHLPDVPSAKEIQDAGLSVAEMMAKQMQKIEELTLYLIEMKKENESLKQISGELMQRDAELTQRITALQMMIEVR